MLQMMVGYVSVLAVAGIYYAWRDGYAVPARRNTVLHERVAYMLWVAANRAA